MAQSPFVSSLGFEIRWRARPPEHIIQPHAAYLGAVAWWKTDPAYSAYTSHPHQLPLPSPLHPSLGSPAAVAAAAATAAAPRGNLHFNRQSCSPSPNEGMCSGEQQETHPAAQVSNEPSSQFLGQGKLAYIFSHWASLSAAYGSIYINIYIYTYMHILHNKLDLWNEIWYGVTLDWGW